MPISLLAKPRSRFVAAGGLRQNFATDAPVDADIRLRLTNNVKPPTINGHTARVTNRRQKVWLKKQNEKAASQG
jgi:hypothetical protein